MQVITSRRELLAGLSSTSLLGSWNIPFAGEIFTPEVFGAAGDGKTNDTDAFAALSKQINARGGGTVVLRPVTYIVGRHLPRDDARDHNSTAFPPSDILHFMNCRAPVIVRGNGAILRCASGLRFGTFDPDSGRPFEHPMPFAKRKFAATPYIAMIFAERCTGPIDISDVELDGNLTALQIGGQYGNRGWQIPATGIRLSENTGPERLSRIFTHHHALDGVTLFRPLQCTESTTVTDIRSEYNGRQGCSVTGGRNYVFERCRFNHTGKAGLRSGPGAGVDIEAGRGPIRNVSFSGCEFSDNFGVGALASTGDIDGVSFSKCSFVGTTRWAAWPNKPHIRFSDCRFVGSVIHAYGHPDPDRATKFISCTFLDDPTISPTGEVFGGARIARSIAILPNHQNVLFSRCQFLLTNDGLLPLSTHLVTYSDCEMRQRSPVRSHPAGTYLGTNVLAGNIDLGGSIIRGKVILNGSEVPLRG